MQQDVEASGTEGRELENWLKLTQIPNFSVASLFKLKEKHAIGLADLFVAPKASLLQIGFKQLQIEAILRPNECLISTSLEWLNAKENRFLIHFEHPQYPSLLKQIASPPPLLFGYGNPQELNNYQLAMVGSRSPSPQGRENAHFFASRLGECGWTITSGLALGIDGLSHRGAVSGGYTTIAVLGTAIDKMYPRHHIKLAEDILQNNGVIISEFAPATKGRPEYFPRRNRIISGLSVGTLIVEAAIKSGSLITARYALEQNREVFALPGNIHNPMSAGCHHLIQQGAKLVTCVGDINEEFQHLISPESSEKVDKLQKNTTQSLASDKLLDSVDFEVTPLDIVAQRSGIEVTEVMSQLLEYELRGLVIAVSGGYIKLGEK
ncbi:DNA-processing protein DprA [Paraglaciecola arctica]|uniref:DNA-processing protein DprA n=1 Tax=Paraglaciecola arctica TaxID=1128911 RepID=UPI001C06725D|nr:DNA-processing protein DprA [Paraglaciecola arctica]MBU3003520.1 DNA-processing protein DprA [Paraglaciecola arctica]